MARESGGAVVALSGAKSESGRQSHHIVFDFPTAAAWYQVLSSNPNRVWASLSFFSTVLSDCFLALDPEGSVGGIRLYADDMWVVNLDEPWTGPVYAYLNAGVDNGETLEIIEVESASIH